MNITPARVVELSKSLPAFPGVVTDIIESLDDEKTSLRILAGYAERDPVITGRIFSFAYATGAHATPGDMPRDVFTAISLIGLSRMRQIVLSFGTVAFLRAVREPAISSHFWEHSVAVGICAQKLARNYSVSIDLALLAGLLHDIGQLWMEVNFPDEFQRAKQAVDRDRIDIIDAERAEFGGTDHAIIGAILADRWGLPPPVIAAIRHHHDPDEGLPETLVAITHVAEVISNALDLTLRNDNHVSKLSALACEHLAIDWNNDYSRLFGEIEACTEYACATFR